MTAPATETNLGPLTAVSAWLAARHAKDQETVADNLILAFFPLWQIMRFRELDASSAAFVAAALPEVETAFLQSQRLSVVFNMSTRFAEVPFELPLLFDYPEVQRPVGVAADSFRIPDAVVPGAEQQRVPLDVFDRVDVARTLAIESNYVTKRMMPGPEEEIMQAASVRTAGAATREALNGARGVTNNVMRIDKRVKGFARVTDSNPCPLCALLASRGAVYGKGSFIGSNKKFNAHPDAPEGTPEGWTNVAKVHDNCRCMLRPVYTVAGGFDEAATYFKKLWEDNIKLRGDLSGPEKKRAEMTQWRKLVADNPYDGNQFDLNGIRKELLGRASDLMDTGLAPSDPRVKWASTTATQIRSVA